MTEVAARRLTFGSESVSSSSAQPYEHTATGTAGARLGHAKTVDERQR